MINHEKLTQVDIYRRMTPAQRVRTACALHDFAHQQVIAVLRQQHPGLSKRDILIMAAKRFLGDAADVL